MRAVVFTGHGEPLEVRTVDPPTPDPEGVVVELEACGICRSDWHAWQGDPVWAERGLAPGHVLGHEPAGIVRAVGGEVERVREGDHVTVPFNLADGTCHQCRTGHANLCENGLALGLAPEVPGAFAEQLHIPDADVNVVQLPDSVSSVDMAGLGCRFMTALHGLVHQADLFSEKLEFAERLGARATVDADATDDVPGEIRDITDGGAHVSVDALGIAATCQNSVNCLRTRGQHVQIGLTTSSEGGQVALPTDRIVGKELSVVGAIGMSPARYDELFRFIEGGRIDPAKIVSETVSLEETPEKLAAMTDYDTLGIPVIDEF